MLYTNKFKFLVIVIFLILIPLVYSDVSFREYKESYSSYDTVQLEVIIENITLSRDLTISNLYLLDQNNVSLTISKNIIKVNNTFYVYYFDLPQLSSGNYLLGLRGVNYIENGVNKIGEFFTNLNIGNNNLNVISVRPAYNFYRLNTNQDTSFTITFTNRGLNSVNVVLANDGGFFNLDNTNFNLAPGEFENVPVFVKSENFDSSIMEGDINVQYGSGSYNIPVLVFVSNFVGKITKIENVTSADLSNFDNAMYLTTLSGRRINNLTLNIDINEYYPPGQIIVNNNAIVDLHNINYSFTNNIRDIFEINPKSTSVIPLNGSNAIMLSLNEDYTFSNGQFSGELIGVSSENARFALPIFVVVSGVSSRTVLNNVSKENVTINVPRDNTTVSPEEKKEGNLGLWIVLIVIFLLIILLIFVYGKTRKKKEEFDTYIEKIKNKR